MCWRDDGRRAVRRIVGEHRDQRLDAAGRGADGDELAVRLDTGRVRPAAARRDRRRRVGGPARARRRLDARGKVVERVRARSMRRLADAIDGAELQARDRRLGALRWSGVETITTGIGRSRMIFSRKSRPFMFGISTSSVMTSGSSALMASRACSGSAASPTTSIPGSRDRAARIRPRMVAGIVDDQNANRLHAARSRLAAGRW